MKETGAKKFYLPSADYIWPHLLNKAAKKMVAENGGEITGQEYFPLDHTDYRTTVEKDHVDRRQIRLQHHRTAGTGAILGGIAQGRVYR